MICQLTLTNSGYGCTAILKSAKKLFFTPTYQSDGVTLNKIDLSAIPNNAGWIALLNHSEQYQRLYPSPTISKYSNTPDDSKTETDQFGIEHHLYNGVRKVEFEVWGKDAVPSLQKAIESYRNMPMSVYVLDDEGSLGGNRSESGYLRPIKIQSGSISVKQVPFSPDGVNKLVVKFSIHPDEREYDAAVILKSEFPSDVNMFDYEGLVDVYSKITAITATGCTIELYTLSGTPINPNRLTNLVSNDFVSSTIGTAARVVRSPNTEVSVTATESATKGVYALAWASQTSGSVMIINPKKNGYDTTRVVSNTVII